MKDIGSLLHIAQCKRLLTTAKLTGRRAEGRTCCRDFKSLMLRGMLISGRRHDAFIPLHHPTTYRPSIHYVLLNVSRRLQMSFVKMGESIPMIRPTTKPVACKINTTMTSFGLRPQRPDFGENKCSLTRGISSYKVIKLTFMNHGVWGECGDCGVPGWKSFQATMPAKVGQHEHMQDMQVWRACYTHVCPSQEKMGYLSI
jgi:hypothetical protein